MKPEKYETPDYLLTETGIHLRDPFANARINVVNFQHRKTWAEKRRDQLVLKIKRKKAFWNRVIVNLLTLTIGSMLIFGSAIIGAGTKALPWLGIISGQLTFIARLLLMDKIECDHDFVHFTRKGKTY